MAPLSVFSLSLLVLCPDLGQSLLLNRHHLQKITVQNQHVCYSTSSDTSRNNEKKQKGGGLPPWLPSFGTAATGGLLFGSDIGSSSTVVRILGSNGGDFGDLSALQLGQIASSSLFGAMVASAALIFIGDQKIGRKLELQMASVLFLIGTIVQSSPANLPVEYVGRIIYGLGIGTAMHVAPLYIAETSPNDLRGKLVSLKEAAIVAGIVLGYAAGVLFADWQDVYKASLPFEMLMLIGAFFLVPESPRWLALRNRPEEAAIALSTAQGLSLEDAQQQVVEMTKMTMSAAKADSAPGSAEDDSVVEKLQAIFASPYNRQALTIGVGLVLFQQLSGQPSVLVSFTTSFNCFFSITFLLFCHIEFSTIDAACFLQYFANRIFEKAGLGFEAAVGVGVFKFAMTIVSAALVEDPKWGRRTLLLYGNAGVTASLVGLTALYAAAGPGGEPNQAAIIACILAFVGSYQIGFGPITWLVLSEIFPLKVRSAALSMGTLANFGSNLLVALIFELERVNLGESLLFGQFAVIALIATLFTNKYVFETRGLSLEEIETKLKGIVDDEAAIVK